MIETFELSCAQAIDAFQDALDERTAPLRRSPWVVAHLADCGACRERARGLGRVDRAGRLLAATLEPRPVRRPRLAAIAALLLLAAPAALALATRPKPNFARPVAAFEPGRAVEAAIEALEERRARLARAAS